MVLVTEEIEIESDDGTETDDTTFDGDTHIFGHYNGSRDLCLRWQSVNIPQGAIINSATVSYNAGAIAAGPPYIEATIKGIDEDDTSTFSQTNRASQMTKTTADINADASSWLNEDGGDLDVGWNEIDITTIIQEIIDRSGWEKNNSLSVVIENDAVAGVPFTQTWNNTRLEVEYVVDDWVEAVVSIMR